MRNLCVDVCTIHTRSCTVTALLDGVAIVVHAHILKHKNIVQTGVETLYKHICLPVPETRSPVDRTAEAVRALLFQSVGKLNLNTLATHGCHVQILIVCLWGTETCRIGEASLQILQRLVQEVHARAEDWLFNEIMLVHAQSQQQREVAGIPLVLQKGTTYANILAHIAVVTRHDIVQAVLLILHTTHECCR